jgi:arylsulfatase A-like enzyme
MNKRPKMMGKGTYFETSVHVPMIVRMPGAGNNVAPTRKLREPRIIQTS